MAKENNSSAMDVDNQNSESVDQINSPRFSINVLQLLKSAQMQHGLRFGDYARYRRYCTARLRRLYKSLKFTHGRGKYSKRAITASMVTEVSRKSLEPCYGKENAARWSKCTSAWLSDW
nr:signal recognition particle subunit SRP68-like isoform X1 [Coffea arabica]